MLSAHIDSRRSAPGHASYRQGRVRVLLSRLRVLVRRPWRCWTLLGIASLLMIDIRIENLGFALAALAGLVALFDWRSAVNPCPMQSELVTPSGPPRQPRRSRARARPIRTRTIGAGAHYQADTAVPDMEPFPLDEDLFPKHEAGIRMDEEEHIHQDKDDEYRWDKQFRWDEEPFRFSEITEPSDMATHIQTESMFAEHNRSGAPSYPDISRYDP